MLGILAQAAARLAPTVHHELLDFPQSIHANTAHLIDFHKECFFTHPFKFVIDSIDAVN
jgi:hypothetical protein